MDDPQPVRVQKKTDDARCLCQIRMISLFLRDAGSMPYAGGSHEACRKQMIMPLSARDDDGSGLKLLTVLVEAHFVAGQVVL